MFVCHGNICRSPMAEFIFKKLLLDGKISSGFTVASSATSTEEIYLGVGNPIYPPARRMLAEHGIPCSEKRAVLLENGDYDKYDMFIGMDRANIRNMHRIFGGDPDGKIHLLMDFTSRTGEVADPWYTGGFERAYLDIYEGCLCLFNKIVGDGKNDFRKTNT